MEFFSRLYLLLFIQNWVQKKVIKIRTNQGLTVFYYLGPLKPDWTIKLLGTMIIFLLNGCSIRSEVTN